MKNFFLNFWFLMSIFTSCQEEKFTVLESCDNDYLLSSIICDSSITYWELNNTGRENNPIFRKGNMNFNDLIQYERQLKGFFAACLPGFCAYSIEYFRNDIQYTINTEDSLQIFIGEINNAEEAFLIAEINGFDIDCEDSRGKSFKKYKDGYLLKVSKIKYCPYVKEAFLVEVSKDAKIRELKSLGVYQKTEECIVF